ncbi:hypothetical protein [Stenotrophomonas phage BUCT609]|uniref:Uncharacterized protein n=1 Tax=Stenotrophomonas phage BUCT609 TaxID=2834250 RepID=A0A8E6UR98_9CAUD|nr:hypothetical protein [Stenotrophomonas phage BUCT609]
MSYKNIKVADLRKEIKSIEGARAKLVDRIQQAALACVYHAHKHGDVTLAIELCVSVGKGMKHESLRLWMEKFGPMVAKKESILSYSKGKVLEGVDLDSMMAAAEAMQWHEFETEKKAEAFSLDSLVASLLRKLDNAVKEGYEVNEEDAKIIAALRERKPSDAKAATKAGA